MRLTTSSCHSNLGSALNDEQLRQEIDLVHQSSIKAFARPLAKVRRPEVDTHTLRNGEHDFADTINLLLSIGEQTVTAINSNVPVSPFPYNVGTHMDIDNVLTKESQYTSLKEIPADKLPIFNSFSLLVKTW
jgi:hypothetical protein